MFSSLICGIKNLIYWFPVIWNDMWWQESFFYILIRHKLKSMEKGFRHNRHHSSDMRQADQIKTCILLLDRLLEEGYTDKLLENHKKRWGARWCGFKESHSGGYKRLGTEYINVKTKGDATQEQREFLKIAKLHEYLIEQDLDLLFKIIRKNIRCWWD